MIGLLPTSTSYILHASLSVPAIGLVSPCTSFTSIPSWEGSLSGRVCAFRALVVEAVQLRITSRKNDAVCTRVYFEVYILQ